MIRIDCKESDPRKIDREWLETDGRGGYASSTLEGCHTRRYHGLLVANLTAPEGRHVLLSKLEDSLLVKGEEHFFTSHQYPGVLFPPGPPLLREFILDIHPRFTYRVGKIWLQKSVLLVRNRGILLIRYDLDRSPKGLLRLKPFLAYRGYHGLARANPYLRSRTERIANGFTIEPYAGMPPLFIWTSASSRFIASPLWYKRFEYTEERERGFDWEEDLFLPGIIEVPVEKGGTVILAVSCKSSGEDPIAIWETEILRRRKELSDDEKLADGFTGEDRDLFLALIRAGRQFLITTPSGRPAIIAGYPWFGSWGRDALISLPGLAFSTGRIGEGIEILTEIGRHEQECLLPNFFSACGAPEAYNTVDSSLLYFRAVQELFRVTDDIGLIHNRFWPVMKRIITRFLAGTRFGIGIDERGLLHAGEEVPIRLNNAGNYSFTVKYPVGVSNQTAATSAYNVTVKPVMVAMANGQKVCREAVSLEPPSMHNGEAFISILFRFQGVLVFGCGPHENVRVGSVLHDGPQVGEGSDLLVVDHDGVMRAGAAEFLPRCWIRGIGISS